MIRKWLTGISAYLALLLIACPSWAAHPLITDDAGTQGKGNFQLELNGQHDGEKEDVEGVSVKTTGGEVAAALSYGIAENVDLVFCVPFLWGKEKENDIDKFKIIDRFLKENVRCIWQMLYSPLWWERRCGQDQ